MREVSILVKDTKIVGNLFIPKSPGKHPALLLLHGWTSKQDRYFALAEQATERGYVCLTIDMRGHGRTGGKLEELSRQDFLDDVTAAYDFLISVPEVDPNAVIVSGSSYGGYMAALLCAERPCAAVILRAPADYPDTGFEKPHHTQADSYYENIEQDKIAWRSVVHSYAETRALRAIHAFNKPVFIIESGKDDVVPQTILQGYADAVSDKSMLTYSVMEGAPHSLSKYPAYQKELIDLTLSWVDRVSKK